MKHDIGLEIGILVGIFINMVSKPTADCWVVVLMESKNAISFRNDRRTTWSFNFDGKRERIGIHTLCKNV